jgi:hypothetical protein
MTFRRFALSAVLGACLLATPAFAGPFQDGEAQVRGAYADYRAALFQTNKKDAAATEAAISGFRTKWAALVSAWKANPPPQYAADPKLVETLEKVARINETAAEETKAGKLAEAHETLEEIRDELSALRARNGVTTFSDQMNAYHEMMETVWGGKYDGFSAAGLMSMREDAAVLAYLAKELASGEATSGDASAFKEMHAMIVASVETLRKALAAGDGEAVKKAQSALKPAYSRMFLKFG